MNAPIYSVTQINLYIKSVLEEDQAIQGVLVEGEISNYKMYPSGHHYFSLKDSQGAISCVLFKRSAARLKFRPENGMKVVAFGSVNVYPRDGKYQLLCQQLMPAGLGDLHVAFEQRKEQLSKEGLFDPAHKKPIPAYPDTIALITSAAGAAVRDMLRILGARWPMTKVKIMGVRVQGAEAPAELIGAIRYANRWQVADLLIIGRGGGSMEDLWAFNDEGLARAIYQSEIPVISAVGHEPDFVISDYVADLRAATPSNGAELAVPDQNEIYAALLGQKKRLLLAMNRQLTEEKRRLARCTASRQLTDPRVYVQDKQLRLDSLQRRLGQSMERVLSVRKQRFGGAAAALDAMSPLKVLGRGYSMTTDAQGTVITGAEQVQPGDRVQIQLRRGSLDCAVVERSLPDGESENL
jgi:exodeoxyribonuclease VII large subunit